MWQKYDWIVNYVGLKSCQVIDFNQLNLFFKIQTSDMLLREIGSQSSETLSGLQEIWKNQYKNDNGN